MRKRGIRENRTRRGETREEVARKMIECGVRESIKWRCGEGSSQHTAKR